MSKIIQLDPHLANLIAAGEVVERPASVVKELLENSIDAGAKTVTVEIQNGGMTLLRVRDDGCGMGREDAKTAFLRHATSKLRRKEDLEAIGTLGFRGEALAATAAVSKIDLLTRTAEDEEGTRLHLEAGKLLECEPAGCPVGTNIVVRDLFYNTPARMKFMKRDSVEASAVAAALQKQALAHPEISFRLIKDGEPQLQTPGDGQLLSAVVAVLGRQAAGEMIPVESRWEGISVSGYVSRPTATRGTRNYQNFFVNHRYIKSRTLTAALEEAYRNQIMAGRFPACVLNLTLPLGSVDVNVHPAKTEVKFLREREVFDCLHYGVKGALNQAPGQVEFALQGTGNRQQGTGNRQQATGPLVGAVIGRPPFPARDEATGNGQQATGPLVGASIARPAVPRTDEGTGNREQGTGPLVGASIARPAVPRTDEGTGNGQQATGDGAPVGAVIGRPPAATGDGASVGAVIGRPPTASGDGASVGAVIGRPPASPAPKPGFFRTMTAEEYRSAGKAENKPAARSHPPIHTMTGWEYRQMIQALEKGPKPTAGQAILEEVGKTPALHSQVLLPRDDDPRIQPPEALPQSPRASAEAETPAESVPLEPAVSKPSFRYVGEVLRTYIIVEQAGEVLLIDKHAAHERINFERLLSQGQQVLSQTLLLPRTCRLDKVEAALLLEHRELLLTLGYDLDDLGEGDLLLRAIPSDIRESDAEATLSEIAGHLQDGRLDTPQRLREEALHTIACKAAIKAGYVTDPMELEKLAAQVLSRDDLKYCPHGRPICVVLTQRQIEKQFKRIQ